VNSVTESAAPEGESHAIQAPHEPVIVIDERDDYLAAVEAIAAGHGSIGIDAERASGYRYSQRAYLIQIYRRGAGTFLFDPPAIGDFRELNDVIAGEEWILHAATQDLTCLREVGLHPTRLFDTELGARLAGLPRVGLGTVVDHFLGIHLAKEHSSADWSTRPLPQAWLVYAALDVELLVDLREALGELLDSADKHDIAQQEFDSVLARDLIIVRAEPWRRLSGVHSVRGGKNLAVARELWLARDAYAQEVDTAPGRLVPDSALVAAARVLPETKRELSALKEFNGRASRPQLDRWWTAIQTGLASTDIPSSRVPNDTLPPPRVWSDKNPEADRRLKAARALMTEASEQISIPIENLLTPDYLRRVAWTPPAEISLESVSEALRGLGARPWQLDVSAQSIAQAFVEANQTPEDSEDTES